MYNFLRTIVKRAGAETEQELAPYRKAQQERQQQQKIHQQHHPIPPNYKSRLYRTRWLFGYVGQSLERRQVDWLNNEVNNGSNIKA